MINTEPGGDADGGPEQEQARRLHQTLVEQLRLTRTQLTSARASARRPGHAGSPAGDIKIAKLKRDVTDIGRMISTLHSRFPGLAQTDEA